MPAKVKEVYLHHLLESLPPRGVRSAIIFVGTCRGCQLLALLLRELGLQCAELHSGGWGRRAGRRCCCSCCQGCCCASSGCCAPSCMHVQARLV